VLLGVQSGAVPDEERPQHLRGLLNARSEASATARSQRLISSSFLRA